MCHILILDDDTRAAEALKPVVEGFDETVIASVDIVFTIEEGLEYTQNAVNSGHPYTVFLVDQRLGPGKDGIEVMKELIKISPESSAIIFTGVNDPDGGIRAYDAGAFRYLVKPIEPKELTFVLNSLLRSRREKVENSWRKIFSEMVENALHQSQFQDVAKVVVDYSLKLGFERVHLFWIPRRDEVTLNKSFVGVASAGEDCISAFNQKRLKLNDLSFFNRVLSSRDVVFITEKDIEKKFISELEQIGLHLPASGFWIIPLWSGQEILGALVLDFWKNLHFLGAHERDLLNFFARQVSVTLEHASLYNKEKRTSQETEIISKVGRQVSTRAATQDLTKLLEQIREQVGRQLDVSNFSIFLYDDKTNTLNFELAYENGVPKDRENRLAGNGIEEYMLSQGRSIDINDVEAFLIFNGIEMYGKVPWHWLGAPLREGDKIIGGVSIYEFQKERDFSERDKFFLSSIADQVAGAIQISNFKKFEDEDKRQIQLLHRASIELLRIARKSEGDFWLTVLTIATANFGLGFNRALLFLTRNNQHIIQGYAGIGENDVQKAFQDWEIDVKRKYDFTEFLNDLEEKKIKRMPFDEIVQSIEVTRDELGDYVYKELQAGRVLLVVSDDGTSPLPPLVIETFKLTTYAILPIWTSNHEFGFVIVDNAYNQKPLNRKTLDNLQTLLTNAGLIGETLRLRAKSEDLLDANFEILGGAGHQQLGETLSRICKTARKISKADWAVIHSLRKIPQIELSIGDAMTPIQWDYEIDLENIGYDGELKLSILEYSVDRPHLGGISMHVLQEGILVVDNVETFNQNNVRLNLYDNHFIKAEDVKALIGIAVKDPYTMEILGIFYLDYRELQSRFSELEIQHAKSLASLAAVAISNHRRLDEHRQRKLLLAGYEISDAIGPALRLDEILPKVLTKLKRLFADTSLCILLFNEDNNNLYFAPGTSKFYEVENFEYKDIQSFPLDVNEKGSIACKVARAALQSHKSEFLHVPNVKTDSDYLSLNPRTTSELAVSLMSGNAKLLGVLVLERVDYLFDDDDIVLVKMAANQLSAVIAQVEQNEEIGFYSTVSTLTAWASDIAHDINHEVGNILDLADLIREWSNGNSKILKYSELIEESAMLLSSVGPWGIENREAFLLDEALGRFLEPIALQRDIEIIASFNTPDVYVLANPSELQRILRHLVKNADKVMLGQPEKKIEITTRVHNDGKVELLFRDFGPGVQDEEIREAIFRRRVEKDTDGGYGLLLIRQLVESMGSKDIKATIRLLPYDPAIPGAVFSIKLPICDQALDVE